MMLLTVAIVLFFLLLGQIKPISQLVSFLNYTNLLLLGATILFSKSKKVVAIIIAILMVEFIMLSFSIFKTTNINVDQEPPAETYRSDEMIFLKTFFLLENGKDYYNAFKQAYEEDLRFTKIQSDVFSWRLPFITYVWKIFADTGSQIRILFIILSCLTLICSYLLTSKILINKKYAILAPYILMPYLLDSQTSTSFLFTEWWAFFLFIFGLTCYFYKKFFFAHVLFIFACFVRELFVLPVLSIAVADAINRKKYIPLLLTVITLSGYYLLHAQAVIKTIEITNYNVGGRLHFFSKELLLNVLAFSTRLYRLAQLRIGSVFLLFAFVGLLNAFLGNKYKSKQKNDIFLIIITFLSFGLLAIASSFFGTASFAERVFSDYWGITFLPLAIIFSTAIIDLPKTVPILKKHLRK